MALLSKPELLETFKTLGWGNGVGVHIYNEQGRDMTDEVQRILGNNLTDVESGDKTLAHLVKRFKLEGNWRQMLSAWLRGFVKK